MEMKKFEQIKQEIENMLTSPQFEEDYEFNRLKLNYLKNNAKIALFKEVIPKIIEIFKTHEGQPYNVEIQKEIEEETNCYLCFLLDKRSILIQRILIQPIGNTIYSFEVKSNIPLSKDAIKVPSLEDFRIALNNTEYIESVDETIDAVLDVRKQIERKMQEIKELCYYHNNKVVDTTDYVSVFIQKE